MGSDDFNEQAIAIAREMGISPEEVARREAFLEIRDEDAEALAKVHHALDGCRGQIVDALYRHLGDFDELQPLLGDTLRLDRLKCAQSAYFESLTLHERGWESALKRLRIGMIHQRIGLEPKWYLGAYRKYFSDLVRALWRFQSHTPERFIETFDALFKRIMFDIELALETYFHANQRAIAEKDRFSRSVLEGLPIGLGMADAALKMHYGNPALVRMFGLLPSFTGYLGQRVDAVIPVPGLTDAITRVLAGRQPENIPLAALERSREMRFYSLDVSRTPVEGETMALFTIQDVTERERANAQVRRSESLCESTFDHASIGIAHTSHDGRVLRANCHMHRLLGVDEPDLVGQQFGDFIHPDDRVAGPERRYLRRDGSIVWADVSQVMIPGEDGAPGYCVNVMRDISDRKAAEASQRLAASVFENAIDGIIITDDQGVIVSVNPAFTEITGYQASEAVGKKPSLLRSGRQAREFYEQMWNSIVQNGRWEGEIWNQRKNGEQYCEMISIGAVRNGGGRTSHYCAIFADITAQKRAEAELQRVNASLEERVAQRTAELERAYEEMAAFSYSVSHDLRSPLRAMTGFSAIVLDANKDRLDPESVNHLRRVEAAAQRMALLIDDLLELSRLSRKPMLRTETDLSDLARQVVEGLALAHPGREAEVSIQPAMTVHGDPGLLRIVLENLIGNAWKFTSRTSRARIEFGSELRDGTTAYFVRDNGAGFDVKYANQLFGAFQRLHREGEFEGTGIGLSIVRRVIARHGGKTWGEGEEGKGATFHFTIA